MKKAILSLVFAAGLVTANAQVDHSTREAAASFLSTHVTRFNTGQNPVEVHNLDSLAQSLDQAGISYCRATYVFFGTSIADDKLVGGSSEAIMHDERRPFINYRVVYEPGRVLIQVIDGNPSL